MAEAMGRDVTVTFPASNDFAAAIVLYGHVVRWNMRRPAFPVPRFTDVADRVSLGDYSGTMSVRCWIDKTSTQVPIIPSAVVVTVTIAPGIASGATDTYSIKCMVVATDYDASKMGGGPPQTVTYDLVATPASTDSAGTASITYT